MSDITKKSFITSPIYYVNDIPHIGHAYTSIICDMLKKFQFLRGTEALFLTGTDEHGQKIQLSAQKAAISPQAYADKVSVKFKELWDSFGLEYDIFVRTSDEAHCKSVQWAFEKMYQKGDIYKGSYEGHYCISCESFFTKTQLNHSGNCPDCGKEVQVVQEESYFFALSKYQDRLLAHYRANPHFIAPSFRQNEIISFIEQGLHDLSITRTSFEWGIPLLPSPARNDEKSHVMYVWLDALLSYISPLGLLDSEHSESSYKSSGAAYWANATHVVGKDILRFHGVYWLAFLLSLELPLPKHIYAHGWWLRDGAKMSKSLGNVLNPAEFAAAYGSEALRYFLLREIPFGQDGDFSQATFITRFNSELGNDVGNLLNRLQGMSGKYFSMRIESKNVREYFADELSELKQILSSAEAKLPQNLAAQSTQSTAAHSTHSTHSTATQDTHAMQPHRYIEELWRAFSLANNAITRHEPWTLMKNGQEQKAMALLGLIANILAKASLYLYPIMPQSAEKIARALGFEISEQSFEALILQGELLPPLTLSPTPALFPKIEAPLVPEPTLPASTEAKPKSCSKSCSESKLDSEKSQVDSSTTPGVALIDITDFTKVKLHIAEVKECAPVEKSQKLLKLMVDMGEGRHRQIISGIAQYYRPEELLGRQVCIIANLKPAKLMGLLSEGMILASKDENGLSLLTLDRPRHNGSPVS